MQSVEFWLRLEVILSARLKDGRSGDPVISPPFPSGETIELINALAPDSFEALLAANPEK